MKKQNQSLISVVMPVFNAGRYLREAIESILVQTYRHFEFIIVDDGSTDDSWEILTNYAQKDKRITLLKNQIQRGISKSVRKAIRQSRGQFLARMDGDDVASPNRLAQQIHYLNVHRSVVAVGGQCKLIDQDGKVIGEKHFPCQARAVQRFIFRFAPLQQPTLMIDRQRLPRRFSYYQNSCPVAEEIELLFKLLRYGKVENLPETVLLYRLHRNNTSLKNIRRTFYCTLAARIKAVIYYRHRPHFSDILINLGQLLMVTFLPQKLTLWFYRKIRNRSTAPTQKPTTNYLTQRAFAS